MSFLTQLLYQALDVHFFEELSSSSSSKISREELRKHFHEFAGLPAVEAAAAPSSSSSPPQRQQLPPFETLDLTDRKNVTSIMMKKYCEAEGIVKGGVREKLIERLTKHFAEKKKEPLKPGSSAKFYEPMTSTKTKKAEKLMSTTILQNLGLHLEEDSFGNVFDTETRLVFVADPHDDSKVVVRAVMDKKGSLEPLKENHEKDCVRMKIPFSTVDY